MNNEERKELHRLFEQSGLSDVFERIDAEAAAEEDMFESWELRYGFKHECHCEEDVENDNTLLAPECWAGAADQAFAKLAETRGAIFGILTSPSVDGLAIKKVLSEVFYGSAAGL